MPCKPNRKGSAPLHDWNELTYDIFIRSHDMYFAGISLAVRPANENRRYIVKTSLIGWAHI